jgi:trehalose utilization protein
MNGGRSAAPLHVLVWAEHLQDQHDPEVRRTYPATMHETIADAVRRHLGLQAEVSTATLHDHDQGLEADRLAATDVLVWWSHLAHDDVADSLVDNLHRRVLAGMGLVVLHSSNLSKIFRRLMGTSCTLRYREGTDRELVWTVAPSHPITRGVPHPIVIPVQEMYGEFFDVPEPDTLVFISSFTGGEVVRSGMCWSRGRGRIFYFSPGHEEHPVYHHPDVRRVLANAVRWCAPTGSPINSEACVESKIGWFNLPRSG